MLHIERERQRDCDVRNIWESGSHLPDVARSLVDDLFTPLHGATCLFLGIGIWTHWSMNNGATCPRGPLDRAEGSAAAQLGERNCGPLWMGNAWRNACDFITFTTAGGIVIGRYWEHTVEETISTYHGLQALPMPPGRLRGLFSELREVARFLQPNTSYKLQVSKIFNSIYGMIPFTSFYQL